MSDDQAGVVPVGQRLPARILDGLHPSLLSLDHLARQCDLRTQPRSGPGGQHRNRTSSGVFLFHSPTTVTAEATERRSQASNRKFALRRLRHRLATEIRTPSELDSPRLPAEERQLRQRYNGTPLRMAEDNVDKPAVLA